ncbi:integrase catalytic domain-containing protein [Trichonephila clavipes]|nr:integrase catalytic domain-containing protein [Trichonephila clavipes]
MIRLAREGFGKDRGSGAIRKDCQKSVHKDEPTVATLIKSTTGAKPNCIFCDHPHLSQDCQKLSDMSYEVRTTDNERKSTETLLTNLPSEHEIYLKTIMIRLRNRDKEVCVRALLDDGSQRSYIEKNLAAELSLSPSGREIFSQGLFGRGISPASEHKRYMDWERKGKLKFWDLEVLGITDPTEKTNESLIEEETLAHFKETIRICEDQIHEVALPWLAGHPALYDKYDAAESRLRTATKRLINENYFEAYDNVFK